MGLVKRAKGGEDTGEDTYAYVDEFNNDDDDRDSQRDVEERETASFRMLHNEGTVILKKVYVSCITKETCHE